jgi:hypothetical protein
MKQDVPAARAESFASPKRRDDRVRQTGFAAICIVFHKEIASRTLMKLMNEVAKLRARDFTACDQQV